jgi:hypothetical protein
VANSNPVILDSRGEADVCITDALYKFALYTATDTLIWTVDNINSTFNGPVQGTTATFSGALTALSGAFSGPVSGTTGTFSGAVSGTTGTFTGNVQMASLNGGAISLRNKIINGDMRVAQRGSTTLSGVDTYGGCDRTFGGPSGFTTSSGNILQGGSLGGVYSSSGFLQSILLTTTGAGIVRFGQKIEALNTAELNGKQITISAKLTQDSGAALNATITVYRPTTTANDFSAQTLLATSSAVSVPSLGAASTAITHTFTLGSTDASKGLAVYVTYAGVGAVTSKSFYIGDLQLEVGPVATPFEQRPIGMELALCQRYTIVIPISQFWGSGTLRAGGTASYGFCPLPVQMRTAPAATPNTNTVYVGDTNTNYTSLGITGTGSNGIYVAPTFATSAGSAGQSFFIYTNASAVTLSAEL